ncbi:MAG: hypothetical protein AB7E70_19410 [Hyphomicrobiaceae bacterium]
MSDEPKTYVEVILDGTKRYGAGGMATAALALSITALATGGYQSPAATTTSAPLSLVDSAPAPTGPRKRLEVATDVEVAPGARISATGRVDLGARAVAIDGCVGQYSEATRICVLSPGPWELHSSCSEAPLAPTTTCEVVVKNTGAVPLKFSGYVEVAVMEQGAP